MSKHFIAEELRRMKGKNKIEVLSKYSRSSRKNSLSIHYSCKDLLTVAQFLGLFPLDGIRNIEQSNLKFKWLSLKMLHSMLLLTLYLIHMAIAIHRTYGLKTISAEIIVPLYYSQVCAQIVTFIKITKNWPKLINKASKADESFLKRYRREQHLRRKINSLIVGSLICFVVEHSMFTANRIITSNTGLGQETISKKFEDYLKTHFHFMFEYIPYSIYVGVLFVMLDWLGNYIWNFGDVFIAAMTIILITRFKQINERIEIYVKNVHSVKIKFLKLNSSENQKMANNFWKEVREEYNLMSELYRKVNGLLADLILLSYTFSLSYIILQLFNGLRQGQKTIDRIYFYFSFGYLVMRSVILTLFGGWMYEASKAPLFILNVIPTDMYNEEVASAIVTYELVLIQFTDAKLD